MRRTHLLKVLVVILLVAGLLVPSTAIALTSPADGNNLVLGNPSKAVRSTASPNNYLMTTRRKDCRYYKVSARPCPSCSWMEQISHIHEIVPVKMA